MTMPELECRLAKWHEAKFGTRDVDLVRTALKGSEEQGEISKAILRRDWSNAAEECADVFFILLHLCRGLGIDLLDEAEKKVAVIEDRLLRKAKV